MNRLLTSACLSATIVIATLFSPTSTCFGQEKKPENSLPAQSTAKPSGSPAPELWRQVEILRTTHGVPHIRVENLRAAGYALAWLQSEDYGPRTAMNVLEASGQKAKLSGHDAIESDFLVRRGRNRAIQTYHLLDQETRELHSEEFPAYMPANFSGYDVATIDIGGPSVRKGGS